MACAVFWDIENIEVPKGQSVTSIVNQIRSTIIKPHNLDEIFFFCICDVHKLPPKVGHSLTNLEIDIVQAYNGVKDSADMKIINLMRKFVKFSGQDCTIILISGDADYYGTLSDLKKVHNVSIHLVRLASSCSSKLDQISDSTYMLHDGLLKPIKSNGLAMYFISVKNYPLSVNINQVMNELNSQTIGSIQNSAILYGNLICIGFSTLWVAEKAINQLNGSRYHGHFLKAELIKDSPLTGILKSIKVEKGKRSKTNKCEVKQLAFIRVKNSSDPTCTIKFIKFCVACTTPISDPYILTRKSFLWIVFSLKSHAQECLLKLKILYPDAVISEPPSDLVEPCLDDPYTVQLCDEQTIVSNTLKPDVPSNMAECPLNDPTASCDQVVKFLNNATKMEEKVQNVVTQKTEKSRCALEFKQDKTLNSNAEMQADQIFTFMSGNSSFEDKIIEEVEPCKSETATKDVPPESENKPKSKRLVILRAKYRQTFNDYNSIETLNCL